MCKIFFFASLQALEKQRLTAKGLETTLQEDQHFLQEIQDSFCQKDWPLPKICRWLLEIRDILRNIDHLLVSSNTYIFIRNYMEFVMNRQVILSWVD